MAQIYIGALNAAERNLRRAIDLCREIQDEFWEAVHHKYLIQVLVYAGSWEPAEKEFEKAINIPKNAVPHNLLLEFPK